MASFQAKKGCERQRKRENRNYCTDQFQTNPKQRIPKKNFKNQKTALWLLFKPKLVEKGREREKIKIIISISSYPIRYKEFQKNSKKIKKQHYGFFSSQNRLTKAEKKRK